MKKLPAEIRITEYFDDGYISADVLEPDGVWRQWTFDESVVPKKQRQPKPLNFYRGDELLYTTTAMPKPFHIPFWKLLQHKQGRKARRIKR